ncbi:hypothetical protein AtNW77_Chr3g0210021 [Arabidopsis thaliana]
MPVNFRSWFIWLKRELCLCVKSSIMFYFVFLRRFPMSGLSVRGFIPRRLVYRRIISCRLCRPVIHSGLCI